MSPPGEQNAHSPWGHRLRNWLQDTEETGQLNATCDLGLGPGPEKTISGTMDEM